MPDTETKDLSPADATTKAQAAIEEGATKVVLVSEDGQKWTLTVTKP